MRSNERKSVVEKTLGVWLGISVSAFSNSLLAMDFSLGDNGWTGRFDNTLRYTVGMRTQARDNKIGNTSGNQNADYSFDRGDIVTRRFGLLSELDITHGNDMGVRVSGDGWYDSAYDKDVGYNPGQTSAGGRYQDIRAYQGNHYSSYVKRYYAGPSAELLDAFGYYRWLVGDTPVSVKAGRHNVYWGESLFNTTNGISYSQSALDIGKSTANPGTEAKELYLPVAQISTQVDLSDSLALQAQYLLDWEASRYSEGGTYLAASDYLLHGPDQLYLTTANGQNIFATRQHAREGKSGDWGVNLRWSPSWLDGSTVGAYYRVFDEKLPWLLINSATRTYRASYARDTRLYGLSLGSNVEGVAVGAELVYRQNTALNSVSSVTGDEGARGDTLHGLFNLTGTVNQTPLFDALNWSGELAWSHWLRVTENQAYFKRAGSAACSGGTWDNCVTRDYVGVQLSATPTWYSVRPGMDLSFPISYGVGVHGNSAVLGGGNQGSGSYSLGPSLLIQQRYQVDLKYNGYMVRYKDDGTKVTVANGALISDRGWLALTLKTSF